MKPMRQVDWDRVAEIYGFYASLVKDGELTAEEAAAECVKQIVDEFEIEFKH